MFVGTRMMRNWDGMECNVQECNAGCIEHIKDGGIAVCIE
jgi:hypothetical protein